LACFGRLVGEPERRPADRQLRHDLACVIYNSEAA